MGGVFSSSSSSKKPPPPGGSISDVDRAVLDLKNARDRLRRYRTKLDRDEKRLLERAGRCQADGNERGALNLLRLRRHKIRDADNVDAQLLTVLNMVDTISGKENEREVVGAMKTGKDALKRLHEEMSVDDVISLMDDIQEESEVERQINDILKEGVGMDATDESEVERELAELEKELAAEAGEAEPEAAEPELPTVPTTKLPDAPVTELPDVPTGKLSEVLEERERTGEKRPERVAVAS